LFVVLPTKVEFIINSGRNTTLESSRSSTSARQFEELAALRRRIAQRESGIDTPDSLGEYRSLIDNLLLGMYRMSPQGKIIMANQALAHMLGYASVEELLTLSPSLGDDYDPEYVHQAFRANNGRVVDVESNWRRKDGSSITVRESALATYDDRGRPLHYDGIVEDLTERKKVEEAHTISVKLLASVLESVDEAIVIVNAACRIVKINRAAQRMWGYETEALIGRPLKSLIPALSEIATSEDLIDYAAARAAQPRELRAKLTGLRKGGGSFAIEIEVQATKTGKSGLSIVTVRQPAVEPPPAHLLAGNGASYAALPAPEIATNGASHAPAVAANGASYAALPAPETAANSPAVARNGLDRAAERMRGVTNALATRTTPIAGRPAPIREYWKLVRKRLWLVILILIAGGGLGSYYSYIQVPQYRATTTLFLNPAVSSPLLPYQPSNSLQSLSNTYSEFMRTRSFAGHVVDELNLQLSPDAVVGALTTQAVPDTQFFRISATHTNPQIAQALANASARVLIAENIARQQAEQQQLDQQQNPNDETKHLIELRTSLQTELDNNATQIKNTQDQIAALQAQPQSEENDKRILSLQDKVVSLQTQRVGVLNSLAQAQSTLTYNAVPTSNVVTAVVVDEATVPGAPLPGRTTQIMLQALVLSLMLGVGLAFVLEYIDYTVKTPEVLDAIYGIPVQGVIGVLPAKHGKQRSAAHLVTISDPRSPIAESVRSLRTSVQVAGLVSPMRNLMVTSAGPGEGKTFVAINLAVSLAQSGTRVLLVDADLRKPSLHYAFGLQREPGFTNLVLGHDADPADFIQNTSVENLQVLTCGTIPPNPAELLGSPYAASMMQRLEQMVDMVIYDTPPAATVTDAVVIAPRVDAILQVVLAGKTRVDLVRRCRSVLERAGGHILGPVLNRVGQPDLGYYSYYYSYGYYQNGRNGYKPAEPVKSRGLFGGKPKAKAPKKK
jgi:capsular exopolysaccharide synthesis family protein